MLAKHSFILLVMITYLYFVTSDIVWFRPEQIHISYGEKSGDIVVTWSTFNETKDSIVEYGIGGLILQSNGTSVLFTDGGSAKHSQYIHKVTLSNLTPDRKYMYHCGSNLGWSNLFSFRSPPLQENWQPHIAIYGDMGNENAQSLTRLQEETQREMYDAILHVGDFAYDMNSQNAEVGDEFMRQIESIAAYVPYMTCPGNHEEKYNFSNYRYRFNMPNGNNFLSYSFNMGPLHIISISTEVYYFLNYGIKPLIFQYQWLEDDLARANLPENREKQPWIIVIGHRPMYCSNNDSDDCTKNETLTRAGLPFFQFFGLEKLFYNYGVDLEIWAHEHSYERLWPIYNHKIYNGSYNAPYVNPMAPVHFTTGSAGCKEGRDSFIKPRPEWSAFISRDYGFTRLKAYNKSHLHFEQVSDDKGGAVIDSFWIIKDSHDFYPNSVIDWAKMDSMRLKNFL
ncbi:hypothetical protein HHI36_004768 [Cryptolaemus montrouzieri]|uniref:Purple acid phosphatase n=1 Tax=Cryptolaemus montrouzieri TaxID=559131 RepID=A0ABD2NSG0_9CUCU